VLSDPLNACYANRFVALKIISILSAGYRAFHLRLMALSGIDILSVVALRLELTSVRKLSGSGVQGLPVS